MMSFDLTRGEVTLLVMTVLLVLLPSRVPALGNLLGRLFSKTKPKPE